MAFIESGKTFDKKESHEKLKKVMSNKDVKPYLLNIPADLFKQVKIRLIYDEKKLRTILIEYLNKYINE